MSPLEVGGGVVVDVVVLLIDALFADLQFPLWLSGQGRGSGRLHADPDGFDRGVHVLPVSG